MAQRGEDCEALLVQLKAVSAAVEKVAAIVLREHVDQCLKAAIASGDREAALAELDAVLRQLPALGGSET
jgi:DNA-binding FrmR family transcriptional regulator